MAIQGRTTVYNYGLVTKEDWEKVNSVNKRFLKDFLNYCVATDKSPQTINQYEQQLKIFFVWNLKENDNKNFVEIKKRDYVNFFGNGRNELGWSPARLASLRAVLSSLSNYIERVMDDEYPTFKNVVKVLEPIHIEPVREKTILTWPEIQDGLNKLIEQGEIQIACFMALLYSSGMRKAEAVQMKVEFFKPENIVFDLMYRTPKIRTKGRGKNGKQVSRYVFTETFDRYFNLWMEERGKLGIESPWLFVVPREEGWVQAKIASFNCWSQKISKVMGVNCYAHNFRHCWTSNLKKQGYPDSVIQKLQNWADPKMVSVYNDITDEEELEDFFKVKNNNEELKGD